MVQAVFFAVRNAAGTMRGSVGGDGGNPVLAVGSGEDVSLNLTPSSVTGYERSGQDLLVRLADGRTITLAGFFEDPGMPENRLYLSSDGQVIAVAFTDGGAGLLLPAYAAPDVWNKYSTVDDLRFVEFDSLVSADPVQDEAAGMAAFVPGLLAGMGGSGLAAAAIIGGGGALIGGGGGSGGSSHTPPGVDNPAASVTLTTNTPDPQFPVTGTGHPGDRVTVTLGDQAQSTTVTPDGTWAVVFPPTGLPGDGTHHAVVVVTRPDGGSPVTLDGPAAVIDLTPPALAITQGTAGTGHVENAADHADGVTLGGTAEAGASIRVTAGEVVLDTVATGGVWSVTFTPAQMPGGERQVPVSVTATDALGNRTTLADAVVLDTVPHPITVDTVAGDDIVNAAEAGAALAVTGSSAAGAVVTVTLGGVTQTATTGADGRWSVSFAPGTLAPGSHDSSVTARTVDPAGNPSQAVRPLRVDTDTTVSIDGPVAGDDIVNGSEAAAGVTLTGRGEPGAAVQVTFAGITRATTVAADGTWSAGFTGVAGGDYATTAQVTATDRAGNNASATRALRVDTSTAVSVNAGQAGGDDIISGAERAAGVTITGRGEPGAAVSVTLGGVTRAASVGADGGWAATFAPGDITPGTRAVPVTVTATDAAGNSASATHALLIDTEVTDFRRATLSTGADSVLSAAEAAQGLTVTGTVEPGSVVMLRLGDGPARAASVAADGSWTVTIPPGDIPAGEALVTLTATATDRVGNSATLTEQVAVDTVVRSFARTGGPIAGDGILNAAEAAAGLPLSGTAEPGASVTLRLSNGATRSVTADAAGQWQVTFASADLPRGETGASVTITAIDRAGNLATLTEAFAVDTIAPGSPEVISFFRDANGLRGIGTESTTDSYAFARIDATGAALPLGAIRSEDTVFGETNFRFTSQVPDGSYLVIHTADAAGNQSSTLLVVDNTNATQVALDRPGLAGFDLAAIDLTFAPDARMTIDAQTLRSLTGPDATLLVKGGADDTVTLTGGVASGPSRLIDGQGHTLYALGDTGAAVLLDDDIRAVI